MGNREDEASGGGNAEGVARGWIGTVGGGAGGMCVVMGLEEALGDGQKVEWKLEGRWPEMEEEVEGWRSLMEGMAARRSEGGGGGLRRRLEDGGVAVTVEKNPWPGQGVAAVVAAVVAAAAAASVGLLPRPSLSSHLRGRALLSFFK